MPAHGGDLQAASERWGEPPGGWLDFSASINPLGPAPEILDALSRALPTIAHYPDPRSTRARQALAGWLGLDPAQLLLTNGAAEAISLLCRWLSAAAGNRPLRIGIPAPSFRLYEWAGDLVGAEPAYVPLEAGASFQPDWETIRRQARQGRWQALFWNNPHNPTGTLFPGGELAVLARQLADDGAYLFLDEAFLDFLPDGERLSLRHLITAGVPLFLIGSLTKMYALPGLRLGYLAGPATALAAIGRQRDPWSVNGLAQAVAGVIPALTDYRRRTWDLVRQERSFLTTGLEQRGFNVYPSAANFLLLNTGTTGRPALQWQEDLARSGLLVRPAGNFRGLDEYHMRVAIRTRVENERLLHALDRRSPGRVHDQE